MERVFYAGGYKVAMIKQFKDSIKNQPSLFTVILFEAVSVLLMSAGIIPREFSLYLTAVLLIFIILSSFREAVLFFVFSIPLYTALAVTDGFDSMASWRVLLLALFIKSAVIYFREVGGVSKGLQKFGNSIFKSRLGILMCVFFALGGLSLIGAEAPMLGVKKLIYLANAFALFFVVNAAVKSGKDIFNILKFSFAGAVGVLIIGYAQFTSTFIVPLYDFWQWWANTVIPVFYGANLADLLTYSNTWFSYYEEAEATLRMFSVFPDSHSFALFMLLSMPIALSYFVARQKWDSARIFFAVLIVLMLMSLIFSGTRGTWVGAVPVMFILVSVFAAGRANFKAGRGRILKVVRKVLDLHKPIKVGIISLTLFALLFPVSSQFLQLSQIVQGGKGSGGSAFERISTSLSSRELSNKGRIEIWKSTFESIGERPLLGVGIGNYPVVLGENLSATKEGASAHSLYLDVMAEMGVFAGIVLVLIFIEILWAAVRIAMGEKDKFLAAFAGFFAIYFLWVMSYSVVDVVLLNDKALLFFTVLVGLVYSISNKK